MNRIIFLITILFSFNSFATSYLLPCSDGSGVCKASFEGFVPKEALCKAPDTEFYEGVFKVEIVSKDGTRKDWKKDDALKDGEFISCSIDSEEENKKIEDKQAKELEKSNKDKEVKDAIDRMGIFCLSTVDPVWSDWCLINGYK